MMIVNFLNTFVEGSNIRRWESFFGNEKLKKYKKKGAYKKNRKLTIHTSITNSFYSEEKKKNWLDKNRINSYIVCSKHT